MKVIIDIPEGTYRNIKYGLHCRLTEQDADNIIDVIKYAEVLESKKEQDDIHDVTVTFEKEIRW